MLGRPHVVHDLVLTRAWERRLRGQRQRTGGEVQDGISPSGKTKREDVTKALFWGNCSFWTWQRLAQH